MSDFESTANAAVTKLQEIQEIVSSTQPQFEAAEETLQEVEQEFNDVAQQLLSTVEAIEESIQTARDQQQQLSATVLERLGSLKEHSQELESRSAEEITSLKELAQSVTSHGHEAQQMLQTQLANVQSGLSSVKSALETAGQEASTLVTDLKTNIEQTVSNIETHVQEVTDAGQQMQLFMTDEVQPEIQSRLEAAHQSFDEMRSTLETKLAESRDQVDRSAADAIDQVTGDYEQMLQDALAKTQEFIAIVESIADKAVAAGDAMDSTKDVMNVAMKSTNVGLESVVDTLRNIKEIFEKIV